MTGEDNHAAAPERTPKLAQFLARRSTLISVGILAGLLCAVANLPWQLEEFSQDRQALASFQMVKDGRWLYQQAPRSRTERTATKPPLVAWSSAGLFELTRSWDLAWRVPSLIAAVLLAIALYQTATRRFDRVCAVIALSAFAFNMLTPRLATLVRTDMPLALVVFAVGAFILKHIASGEPWNSRDRLSIFALLTLGNYIKGPIVYVFILPGLLVYEWLRRNRGGGAAWCGWWPWISSLALFIVWVVGGIVTQPGFFDQVVTHEFLGRFSSAEQAPHPPYFYIGHLLQKFAPWLELMLVLAIVTVRKSAVPIRRMLAEISPSTLWLCCWVGGGLIVMSLVPSKRIDRIYPMVAPMCLLLAAQIARANGRAFRWSMLAFVLSIFIALHYVGYKRVYLGYHCQRDALSQFGKSVRDEAAIRHLRYDAIVSHDGALLLYLAKTQFIEIESAIAKWNAGELDAIVGETDKFPALLESCRNSKIGELRATEQSDERARTYGVIVRQ